MNKTLTGILIGSAISLGAITNTGCADNTPKPTPTKDEYMTSYHSRPPIRWKSPSGISLEGNMRDVDNDGHVDAVAFFSSAVFYVPAKRQAIERDHIWVTNDSIEMPVELQKELDAVYAASRDLGYKLTQLQFKKQ